MKVLALAPQVLALVLREKSWPKGKAKTFPPRPRPRGCCMCMLCSHSRCHITVCDFLFRNASISDQEKSFVIVLNVNACTRLRAMPHGLTVSADNAGHYFGIILLAN